MEIKEGAYQIEMTMQYTLSSYAKLPNLKKIVWIFPSKNKTWKKLVKKGGYRFGQG